MKRHRLYEIDLKNKAAFCTVCRYTEIEIKKTRTGKVTVLCAARAKEIRQKYEAQKKRHFEDTAKAENKRWHALTDINPDTCMAICAICGPTDVIRVRQNGKTYYRCGTRVREYRRMHEHPHFFGRLSKLHPLSHIDLEIGTAVCGKCGPVKLYRDPRWECYSLPDKPTFTLKALEQEKLRIEENTGIVDEYKRNHCCKRCGVLATQPSSFRFFEPHLPYAERISTIIRTATPEQLKTELEKRVLYCNRCHRLYLREFSQGIPVPTFKPFSESFQRL